MLGNTCPLFYFHFLPFSQRPFATRFSCSGIRDFVNFIFERGHRETSVKFIRFQYRLLRYILLFLNISIFQIFTYRVFRLTENCRIPHEWLNLSKKHFDKSYLVRWLGTIIWYELLFSRFSAWGDFKINLLLKWNHTFLNTLVDLSRHSLSNIINLFMSIF